MVVIREVSSREKNVINDIVSIHLKAFEGFFLTFMGKDFLYQMYSSYCEHKDSGLLIAEEGGTIVGFVAYSSDFSGLYKYMIKRRLILFALYSIGAFLRRPSAFLHIISAFLKPAEVKRKEKYVELSSIGVLPRAKSRGIGSLLIKELKGKVDFNEFEYITLETDADDNAEVICFYEKNGFVKQREFKSAKERRMYEYRYYKDSVNP